LSVRDNALIGLVVALDSIPKHVFQGGNCARTINVSPIFEPQPEAKAERKPETNGNLIRE
jgi:hypothetical protein